MTLRDVLNMVLKNTKNRLIKLNPAINKHFDRWYTITIEHILAKEYLNNKDFFFIQIGANDGVRCDDIYRFVTKNKLKGIVVEPLKDLFSELEKNYSEHPQIKKVNAAISNENGQQALYRIRPDASVPDWCHGIASFNKSHLLSSSNKIPNINEYIEEELVECITFSRLISENNVTQVDFLQVDVEGFDFEIIKMIDFNVIKPKIIRYEWCNLSSEDNLRCADYLVEKGYTLFDDKLDVIACLDE